jgi:hypothetical protein
VSWCSTHIQLAKIRGLKKLQGANTLAHSLTKKKSFITLTLDPNELEENEEFKGSENPFVFERFYDLSLRCSFEFFRYPFDHQSCFIDVSVS